MGVTTDHLTAGRAALDQARWEEARSLDRPAVANGWPELARLAN
jgi:hypothetical protein